MTQTDFQMALFLQQQFQHEANIDNPGKNLSYCKQKPPKDKCLVDPSWELIDPTPNIHNLFVAFDQKYFWNKLQAVCVEWSKRMTSCAGICYYNGRGGLCRISLSEPLLKLRPRKDLIQTLLHEMIHAYLFITDNNKDRDGHGPEFHKHMYRINSEAGTEITVYHDFMDEVRLYQQHWWRCNGPCQHRSPYFGMVRRATNRAPGPNDRWWDDHTSSCGGTFIKVKEPEKAAKKISKVEPSNTINKYFPILKQKTNNINNNYKPTKNSKIIGLDTLRDKTTTSMWTNSNGTIVVTKRSAQDTVKTSVVSKPIPVVTTPVGSASTKNPRKDDGDYTRVRNHWINKYPSNNAYNKKDNPLDCNEHENFNPNKRLKPNDANMVECPICQRECCSVDINSHLDKCLEQPSELSRNSSQQSNSNEYLGACTESALNKTDDELIACLVCDTMILKCDLIIHLDDCMGDNIFTNNRDFNDVEDETDLKTDEMEKKYNCPVCSQQFFVNEMSDHLNVCLINDSMFDEPF